VVIFAESDELLEKLFEIGGKEPGAGHVNVLTVIL
jgi:hypothetical protein